jgi:hypothetical protein
MTKAYIVARRKEAAEKAVKRKWRQNYIDETINDVKQSKFEGMYKKPTLVIRRVGGK